MKVRVDPEVCQAHAQCVITAPSVFALDDEGEVAIVIQDHIAPELRSLVEIAVRACPVRAISITDAGDA